LKYILINGSRLLIQRTRHRFLNCRSCWPDKRVMHEADAGEGPFIRHRFRLGCSDRGCSLWVCRSIGFDLHLKWLDQPTCMASPYRWLIPLLSGHQNIFGKACKENSLRRREWPGWRLCLDVFLNAHKPDDDPLFCGSNCRFRSGRLWRRFHVCRSSGPGCFHWLITVVVHLEQQR